MFPAYWTNELIIRLLYGEDVRCERCRKPLTYYLYGSGRPPGVFCPTGCTSQSAMDRMNVLIISSDTELLAQAREAYAELGHVALTATGEQALSVLEQRDATLSNFILVDQRSLAEPELLQLLRELRLLADRYEQDYCSSHVVLMIGEDASFLDVPDDIKEACNSLCGAVMSSKECWQHLWEAWQTPIGVPLTNERTHWQHLQRQISGHLRALFPKEEPRDHRGIPPLEVSKCLQTVRAAVDLAREGRAADGRQRLLDGLKRAKALAKIKPGRVPLVRTYQEALDTYDQRFGLTPHE